MIPFCKTYVTGNEITYIEEVLRKGKVSGNGEFTQKCQHFFEARFSFKKCLLTSSCTDALEMAAILLNIKEGDEVIVPSYTFSATANAFVLRGARIIFADSSATNPNLDASLLESLVSPRTKAIVVVHYGGMACDMDPIMDLAKKHNLFVVEDAAQAIDSYYKGRPLGSIGHLSTFSFHQTKNLTAGECGMLVVNDETMCERAQIIWENGTNRAAFFRGEVDKYTWVGVGSAYLPSEITAAFLYAQLGFLDEIQKRRKEIWFTYQSAFSSLEREGKCRLPNIPDYATINGHLFYIICQSEAQRDEFITYLRERGVYAVFHYNSLHKSPFQSDKHKGGQLVNSDKYSSCLVRLPLFFELDGSDLEKVIDTVKEYYLNK
ncbi:MAG: dTDP-4-amino-4,6-dideoxygalactose transaminase [Roseivirga sp.]|nr:dTDP-4-amino-4,6-dideoxygalactose transaminase [Roseivirga sp.]